MIRESITELKNEEDQKVEKDYRVPLHDVTSLEQSAGWLTDWLGVISRAPVGHS